MGLHKVACWGLSLGFYLHGLSSVPGSAEQQCLPFSQTIMAGLGFPYGSSMRFSCGGYATNLFRQANFILRGIDPHMDLRKFWLLKYLTAILRRWDWHRWVLLMPSFSRVGPGQKLIPVSIWWPLPALHYCGPPGEIKCRSFCLAGG